MHRLALILAWLGLSAVSLLHGRGENRIDAVMEDTFTLQGVTATQPRRADGGFEWEWRGPRDDPEWAWFFNRHDWFLTLLDAYQQSGDDQYARFLLDALDDWIVQHPVARGFTISAAWRPLEAARRILGSWLEVDRILRDHPAFTEERRQRFLDSLRDHGQHLRDHHIFFGNHLVTEVLALVMLAATYPEFPNSPEWMSYGMARLSRAYDEQVYPDGAQKELSTHYQRVVVLNFQKLLNLLQASGYNDQAARWQPRVERMWKYLAGVMKPDGSNPINNDSDQEDVIGLLRTHAPHMANPAWETTRFPWAGQIVFRSTTADGRKLWAWFDAGPRGIDHDHHDPFHFSLSVDNANFLVDNGRYTYAPGPFRRYFAGPVGHNLLLIDGETAEPGPRRVHAPNAQLHYAQIPLHPKPDQNPQAADFIELAWSKRAVSIGSNPRAADWQRLVIHLRGIGWLVADTVLTFQPRMVSSLWHWDYKASFTDSSLHLNQQIRFQASIYQQQLEVTAWSSGLGPVHSEWFNGREFPSPKGWTSRQFNHRMAAPMLQVDQPVDRPTTLLWVFQATGGPAITATSISSDQVEIHIPTHGDLILDAMDPAKSRFK